MRKLCSKCNRRRDAFNFYFAAGARDKLNAWCKDCHREWRRASPRKDVYLVNARAWKDRNKKSVLEYSRQYKRDNRVAVNEYKKQWYHDNKHRLMTPEFIERKRELGRQCYRRNIEAMRIKSAHRKALLRSGERSAIVDYDKVWETSQGVCYLCLRPVYRDNFHFDHKKPLARGGKHTTRNLAVTHPVCNTRKGAKIVRRGAFAGDGNVC